MIAWVVLVEIVILVLTSALARYCQVIYRPWWYRIVLRIKNSSLVMYMKILVQELMVVKYYLSLICLDLH